MANILTINSIQFATSFLLRPEQYSWLLGSGASASSGIPTGYMMIRDFKTMLFCQETGLPRNEVDSTDPLWVQRIDDFFNKRSILPKSGNPSEYSAAFEAVYPTESERRKYIENAVRKGTPSFSHRVLASLITTKRVPCIFTTNFDPLIEQACTQTDLLLNDNERAMPTLAAIDSAGRAERCLRESGWPLIAKLHGDYQSTELKNTEEELKSQDESMRLVLTQACLRFGLIIIGYSGRDKSVMDALEDALQEPNAFPSGIYWVARSLDSLLPSVKSFLDKAVEAGVSTTVVESQNFDELSGDVLSQIKLPDLLHEHIYDAQPTPFLRAVTLPSSEALKFPILRCSALPIKQLPLKARRIRLASTSSTVKVRELLRKANVYAVAACNGKEIAAFGHDEQLIKALAPLGAQLDGTVELKPETDSWAHGLLYDALTKALCRRRPLVPRMRRSGHAVIVARVKDGESKQRIIERNKQLDHLKQAYGSPLDGNIQKLDFHFSEGIRIRLEQCNTSWWCVYEPFTFVQEPRADIKEDNKNLSEKFKRVDPAADWRRERWAQRYNFVWAKIIDAWARLLSNSDDNTLSACGIKEKDGVDAVFNISGITAWSRPAHHHEYFNRSK